MDKTQLLELIDIEIELGLPVWNLLRREVTKKLDRL